MTSSKLSIKVFSIYNCINEECGEVVGLATDNSGSGRIFYFLQYSNGTVELYLLDDIQNIPQIISTTDHIYA